MSMPSIPEGKHRPNMGETIIDLLESIALEEIAISHILNAQGEKVQEVIKKYSICQIEFEEMLLACKYTQEMVNSLIMKEWLLYNKLGTVINISTDELKVKQEVIIEKKTCPNFVASGYGAGDNCSNISSCDNCIHYKVCKNI